MPLLSLMQNGSPFFRQGARGAAIATASPPSTVAGQDEQPDSTPLIQAHLEEYKYLKQLDTEVIKLERQIIALAATVSVALLPFIADRIAGGELLVLFLLPLPLATLGVIHLSLHAQHLTIGRYIYDRLRPVLLSVKSSPHSGHGDMPQVWEWEHWHRSDVLNTPLIFVRSLLTAIEFLAIFLPAVFVLAYLFVVRGGVFPSGEDVLFGFDSLLVLAYFAMGLVVFIFRYK